MDMLAAAAASVPAGIPVLPLQNDTSVPMLNLTYTAPGESVYAARNPTLLRIIWVSAVLSIIGSFFIILSYVIFPTSRKFSRRILVFLSLADLISAGNWIWSTFIHTQLANPSPSCMAQGFILQLFYLASYMWTSCFAFHLYQLIWKQSSTAHLYEKWYHVIGWGVPILIDVYFLVKFALGDPSMGNVERPWCWISSETKTTAWSLSGSMEQMLFFYVPLTVAFLYNVIVYVFLARVVGKKLAPEMETKIRKRLLLYLLVFVLCSIWGLINRIYVLFTPKHNLPMFLVALESFFSPLQGFLNSLVYGMNEQLRHRYATLVCKCRRQRPASFSHEVRDYHTATDTSCVTDSRVDSRDNSDAPYERM